MSRRSSERDGIIVGLGIVAMMMIALVLSVSVMIMDHTKWASAQEQCWSVGGQLTWTNNIVPHGLQGRLTNEPIWTCSKSGIVMWQKVRRP